jgi:ElaB/YqjD/DUF883 family membrane-anchored ribosome-binding protein
MSNTQIFDTLEEFKQEDGTFAVPPALVMPSPEFSDSATGEELLPKEITVEGKTAQDISGIVSKTILVRFQFGLVGNSKGVPGSAVLNTDADLSLMKVSKQLLDSEELSAISKADQKIRKWIDNTCLPFDSGLRLLPIGLIDKAVQKLEAYEGERKVLVDAFIAAYPALQAEAQKHLGSQYNPSDYPHVDILKGKFYFSWGLVNLGTPDALKHISTDLFNKEKAKFEASYSSAQEEITNLMRTALYKVVTNLQDKLTPGDDGSKKILKESAIVNVQKFLDDFPLRNVTNDTELEAVVAQVRELLSGVSAPTIKSSDELRSKVLEGIEKVSANLGDMIEIKANRKFRDDDDELASSDIAIEG